MKSPNDRPGKATSEAMEAPAGSSEGAPEMLPVLVVLVGMREEDAENLRARVTARLRDWGTRALEWVVARQVPDVQAIEQSFHPLMEKTLWDWLVEQQYVRMLPQSPIQHTIRVLFIIDGSNGAPDVASLLEAFSTARARVVEGDFRIAQPTLLWIGDPPDLSPDLQQFWQRLRIGAIAAGGLRVNRDYVLEAAEHITVALISSELSEVIEGEIGDRRDEVAWLVAGAAALLSRLDRVEQAMHEMVVEKIAGDLLAPLSEKDVQQIFRSTEMWVKGGDTREAEGVKGGVYQRLLNAATDALMHGSRIGRPDEAPPGWKLEVEGDGKVVACDLQNEHLLNRVFGPYRGGIPSPGSGTKGVGGGLKNVWRLLSVLSDPLLRPGRRWQRFEEWRRDLAETLQQHYAQVWEVLELWIGPQRWRGLAAEVANVMEDWQQQLGGLMDPGYRARQPGVRMWYEGEDIPTGFLAVLLALFSLEYHLVGITDLCRKAGTEAKDIVPLPVAKVEDGEDGIFRMMAEKDTDIISAYRLAYAHFARHVASPWGALLNAFPAWPLGAILVSIVLGWPIGYALGWVGLVLVLVVLLAVFYEWAVKGKRYLDRLQHSMYERLKERIYTVTARVLRDYRWWLITQVREREFIMRQMYVALARRRQQARSKVGATLQTLQKKGAATYVFGLDEGTLREECERITEKIDDKSEWRIVVSDRPRIEFKYESGIAGLLVERLLVAQKPASASTILATLEQEIAHHVRKEIVSKPDLWMPGRLANEVDEFKEGRRLEWLMRKAHPLGVVDDPILTIDVLLGDKGQLGGPEIRQSRAYHPDIRMPSTRQSHEETCVRILVESRKKGKGASESTREAKGKKATRSATSKKKKAK